MTARYAWPQYRGPLTLDVVGLEVDGAKVESVSKSLRRVEFEGLGSAEWGVATLNLRLVATEEPPAPLAESPLQAHVTLSGPATSIRLSVVLAEESARSWAGTLAFHRSEVTGVLLLEGHVTAPDDIGLPLLRGSALPWSVVVEPGKTPEGHSRVPIEWVWIDFDAPEAPLTCRRFPSAPYAVVLDKVKPALYLNTKAKGFEKILMAKNAKEEKRRVRDLLSTSVAAAVMRALVRAAFDEVCSNSTGSDDPQPPGDDLLVQACDALADVMDSVPDTRALYTRMVSARDAGFSEVRALWTEFDLAVDQVTSFGRMAVDICQELR